MILSVVIVSYNVKFFLEQCLSSLKKGIDGSSVLSLHTEVYIIDNASNDGTVDFLTPLYPDFHFIQNKTNNGFAKANNQGAALCKGDYILYLNPDTILSEDSLDVCLSFFNSTPDAGAVGIKMVDGTGHFLKESKRGFPTPAASFFKMAGLSRLFPHSKLFSAYYLGHLNEDSPHAVEILTGAFMMVRKSIVEITGGFDEQFFMYAEDIDLSFRIKQMGYQNYYLPQSSIVHFKGESSRKDILYLKRFHHAMELFLKKHFGNDRLSLKLFSLRMGIYVREMIARLQLPFRRLEKEEDPVSPVFIDGNPEEKEFWKNWLEKKKISIAHDKKGANEILYCEGPGRSWKLIITEIANNKKGFSYKFHGSGTHSAVGSNSSRKQGNFFEI